MPPADARQPLSLEQIALVRDAVMPEVPPFTSAPETTPAPVELVSTAKTHNVLRRTKGVAKLGSVVFALYATLSSGGLIDKVYDQFQSAEEVVYDAEPHNDPSTSNYPDFENSLHNEEAWSRVARTMDDLDEHRSGTIHERADQFFEANKQQIMSTELQDSFRDRLRAAEQASAILEVTNEFTEYFGIKTTLLTPGEGMHDMKGLSSATVNVDDLRAAGLSTVDALGDLPVDLVAACNVSVLQFGRPGGDTAWGYYDYESKTATIGLNDSFDRKMSKLSRRLPAHSESGQLNWRILHEFGHGYLGFPNGFDSIVPTHSEDAWILQELLQIPETNTLYGWTEMGGEILADSFAGVLMSDTLDGLAHPDEARRFGSDANEKMLRVLASLEEQFPGIGDYIVAQNGHLLNRSPLDLGR